jgi:hypothetical protein
MLNKVLIAALVLSVIYISASFLIYDFSSPYYSQEQLRTYDKEDEHIIVTLNTFGGYDIAATSLPLMSSDKIIGLYLSVEPVFRPLAYITRKIKHDPVSYELHSIVPKPDEPRMCGNGMHWFVNEQY